MKQGLYKFVEVNNQEIRFIESYLFGPTHKDLVKEGEKATSAGLVSVFDDYWELYDSYSISLKLGCNASIIPKLTQLIGKELKKDCDY